MGKIELFKNKEDVSVLLPCELTISKRLLQLRYFPEYYGHNRYIFLYNILFDYLYCNLGEILRFGIWR